MASPPALSYLEWGSRGKPAAVLLHGITSNAQAWWRVAPALIERDFTSSLSTCRATASAPLSSGTASTTSAA